MLRRCCCITTALSALLLLRLCPAWLDGVLCVTRPVRMELHAHTQTLAPKRGRKQSAGEQLGWVAKQLTRDRMMPVRLYLGRPWKERMNEVAVVHR